MKWALATLALALVFVGGSAFCGVYRKGALIGSAISGTMALFSTLALTWAAGGKKPMQSAALVIAVAFLARIVLVSLGTALVFASNGSVIAFVVAFFVPFFVFAGLEAGHVHSLSHRTGPA